MKKILIITITLFVFTGCYPPPKSDYYKDIKEDEYDLYRFKDETPLPEYKHPIDESHYRDRPNQ